MKRFQLEPQECDNCLQEKTLAFLLAVHKHYDAKYIVKVVDDVYVNPSRLLQATPQWLTTHADYIGCMKADEVVEGPSLKRCGYGHSHTLRVLPGGGTSNAKPMIKLCTT